MDSYFMYMLCIYDTICGIYVLLLSSLLLVVSVVCFMNGRVFRGVQWDEVSNKKIVSRNISSPLSLIYPHFSVGSWARHKLNWKNFPPLYLPASNKDTANRYCTTKLSRKKYKQLVVCSCFFHGHNNINDQYLHQLAEVNS